jgi:hypothetical protein
MEWLELIQVIQVIERHTSAVSVRALSLVLHETVTPEPLHNNLYERKVNSGSDKTG